jgi:putative peptidoglycan lipid II flippase
VVLAGTTFASYVLGLGRDKIFAHTFGAATSLDSYNAAFVAPDFAFNFLVASGIAAAGVPLFMELQRRSRAEAYAYMSALLSVAVMTMFVVGVIIVVFAPFWGQLVAPGLPVEGQVLLVRLLRIMAWSPILFAASNALGALLVAERRFWGYGLSPVLYNVGIILGTLWLAPSLGIMGAAWGTVLGALLHLTVRLVEVWWLAWPLKATWRMPANLWSRTLRLMAPKMIGHPVELITFGVFTNLASHLTPGSITILSFARNFQSVPVSVLGIAMATAVFPALSEAALSTSGELRRLFRRTAVAILFVSAAAAFALFVIRRPLVQLLLGGGKFGAGDVAQTALVLGVFCLAIPTESLSHLGARAFYATQHTLIPVVFSVASLLIAIGSAYLMLPRWGIVALPLGFGLGSLFKTVGLYWLFLRRINRQ